MTSVLNAFKPGATDSKTARAAAKPDKRTGVLPTHGHLAVRPPTAAHLSDDDVERLGAELDAIRDEVLAERGATLDDALKATVHLADLGDAPEFNEVYREFFTEPFPVRTTVGSVLAGILVEIDLVARIPS